MAHLPEEFDFVADANLDQEIKKILLAGLLEEKRHKRDAALKAKEAQDSQVLEKKRLWHNTPLMLALVGTISVFANGLVTYVQDARRTSDSITLKELEAKLKESEKRSEGNREGQLTQLKEEREFAFKVIERELAKSEGSRSRAEVLLFLVRAGILNSLDRTELEKMAKVDYQGAVGIPSTIGKEVLTFVSMESIDLEEVRKIVNFGSYTVVSTAGGRQLNIREGPELLLQRLGGNAVFAKLTGADDRGIWVKPATVCGVRNREGNALAMMYATADLVTDDGIQAMLENAETVVGRLGETTLAKLTMPIDKTIWIKGAAVSRVSENVNGEFGPASARAVLELDSCYLKTQPVKEDVSTARTILNAHGGRIGLGRKGPK